MSTLKCQQLINGPGFQACGLGFLGVEAFTHDKDFRSVLGSPTFLIDGAINLRLASIVVIVTTWGNSTYTRQPVHGGGST